MKLPRFRLIESAGEEFQMLNVQGNPCWNLSSLVEWDSNSTPAQPRALLRMTDQEDSKVRTLAHLSYLYTPSLSMLHFCTSMHIV